MCDERPLKTVYEKDCGCQYGPHGCVTATVGAFRIEHENKDDRTIVKGSLIPGPSCDICGQPWKVVEAKPNPDLKSPEFDMVTEGYNPRHG